MWGVFRELSNGKDKIVARTLIEEIDKEIDNLAGIDMLNNSAINRSGSRTPKGSQRKASSG